MGDNMNLYDQFLSIEKTACLHRSEWNEYRNTYNEVYHLQPQEMCMPDGRETVIDNTISFRGQKLEKCGRNPDYSMASYADFYKLHSSTLPKECRQASTKCTPSGFYDQNTSARLATKE